MNKSCTYITGSIVLVLLLGAYAAGETAQSARPAPHRFYVFDNGLKTDALQSLEAQAELIKRLGFDGISHTGVERIPERLATLDKHGLTLHNIYVNAYLNSDKPKYDPGLPEAIAQLKGRPTMLWLTIRNEKYELSSTQGDAEAVELVRELADLAAKSGIRIALYPHYLFWMERIEDAVRITKKVNRPNVGVTFNLCHWLRKDKPDTLRARMDLARPYLFQVSINGADTEGDWDRLIQPLDRGSYDVGLVLKELNRIGYTGPIGLQCYNIKEAPEDHLPRSVAAWEKLTKDPSGSTSSLERPNLIFILADDLGYGDVGCFGSDKIETPNLDRLAKSGMRWTHFYAASAVCTPTRASCLTGRYPLRFGITQHFKDGSDHLPRGTTTLPHILRSAGYATAHVGKWHLGGLRQEHVSDPARQIPGPLQHGFDHYLAAYEDPNRQVLLKERRLYRDSGKYLVRNDKPAPPTDRHWTDYKVDESLELIEGYHGQGRPFLLNLWYDAPHTPYEPAPEPHLSKYKDRAEGDDLLYRSMVSHLDAGVGRIVDKLNELGIAENTFIFFTSDNGPSFEGSPGPWKGGKADLHEGGIRVPMIASWPGRIPAGTQCDAFGHTNDLLPTFCQGAGVPLPKDLEIDGLSLFAQLTEQALPPPRGTIFWQLDLYTWYPQPGDKPEPYATEVARRGPWKLMARDGEPVELFDLGADPREQKDLLDREGAVRDSLTTELKTYLESVAGTKKTAD